MAKSGEYNPEPFAEGRFRYAYKGTLTTHPTKKPGHEVVVKKKKDSFTWKSTDWNKTIEMHQLSGRLAASFNKTNNSGISIQYVDVEEYQVSAVRGIRSSRAPKLNEYVVVEDYLPGTFKKYTNNYGYISPDSDLMPAFMHWTWVNSRGKLMIADLQGVKSDDKYLLTDPAIVSNSESGREYGCTDMGVEGMAMFFLKHTCNKYCKALPRPTIQDVVGHLNPAMQAQVKAQISSLNTSTAYSHELNIPLSLRKRMASIFPTIATRQPATQATTSQVQPTGDASFVTALTGQWPLFPQTPSQSGPVRSGRRTGRPVWPPMSSRPRRK